MSYITNVVVARPPSATVSHRQPASAADAEMQQPASASSASVPPMAADAQMQQPASASSASVPQMRPPPPRVQNTRKAQGPPPPLVVMTRTAAPAVAPLSVEYMVSELNKPKVMAADAQMQQPASASSASVIDLTWKVVVFCVFLRFFLL